MRNIAGAKDAAQSGASARAREGVSWVPMKSWARRADRQKVSVGGRTATGRGARGHFWRGRIDGWRRRGGRGAIVRLGGRHKSRARGRHNNHNARRREGGGDESGLAGRDEGLEARAQEGRAGGGARERQRASKPICSRDGAGGRKGRQKVGPGWVPGGVGED